MSSNATGERPRTGSIQRRTPLQAHRIVSLLFEVQLPVVCAVRGWAAGLGCQLALAADFTVAAEDSRFWLPFVKRGFTPDSGASWLVPRLVGVARAKELLLLGRPIDGRQAADWGMIHRAVPEPDVDGAVGELVAELRTSATVALGLTKRCIHAALDGGIVDAMHNESMALELSSRDGRLPRRPARLHRAARGPVRGPLAISQFFRTSRRRRSSGARRPSVFSLESKPRRRH